MEESLLEKIVHLIVFLAICGAVLFLGWNEPLSYRFMTPQQIATVESRVATPQPTPNWIHTEKRRSPLDEPAKQVGMGHERRGTGGGR